MTRGPSVLRGAFSAKEGIKNRRSAPAARCLVEAQLSLTTIGRQAHFGHGIRKTVSTKPIGCDGDECLNHLPAPVHLKVTDSGGQRESVCC